MRNNYKPKIRTLLDLANQLPYFSFDDLAGVETDRMYLKILFSRYGKTGKIIRLKKGVYVTREYIDTLREKGAFYSYAEFLANILYQPSYLSMDYILYAYNVLTEIPKNFVSITRNKTAAFSNSFGNFFYHTLRKELFTGFEIVKEGDFTIYRATKAKALFDYLYLRKNDMVNRKSFDELRLNTRDFNEREIGEFELYVRREGSKKMKTLSYYLFH